MRYFDLHCDTVTECFLSHQGLAKNRLSVDLKRASCFEAYFQFYAIWIPDNLRGEKAGRRFDGVYDTLKKQIEVNSGSLAFCTDAEGLLEVLNSGKHAALLSIEGGAALAGSIGRLYDAARKGVRMIALTWNGACELGDGCMVPNAGGLTPFGFEVVRHMERLRMVVDVSHLSEKGFYDVCETTAAPVVATHSNAKRVCGHPRNLTDAQIKEIAARGGLIGLNLYPPFLKEGGGARLDDVVAHIDHILSLAGEQVLAVGADFDGARMPPEIRGIQDMPLLYERLLERYRKATADGIFFDNACRFFLHSLTAG